MGRDVPARGRVVTAATFAEAFASQVRLRPHAPAVTFDGRTSTYVEMDQRVEGMAEQLAAGGVAPGDRVVLVADNSDDHLVAAFAVWRAGAVLVTIYPSSTEAELGFAIASAAPVLVVAGTRVAPTVRAASGATPVLGLDDLASGAPTPSASGPRSWPVVDPDGLALICFTSGSTARPKAVMQHHRGLLGAAAAYARVWHLGPDDTTLVCLPMAWAFGLVTTSMAALVSGGRVLALARAEPAAMLAAMVKGGVTFFAGVTTMFVKLVEALDGQRDDERSDGAPGPFQLRLCISGGEPRNESAFARWQELTGCPVHDVYAASECFPVVTYDPVEDPQPRPGSAGRVVAEAALRLVGPDGGDAPPGGTGEALTRGPALLLGYWGDPDLTAAVRTPDGWYRTGDLVRLDDEGYVHVVGRASAMIIRGGANVSPAEVEAVLGDHPDVREVAVVGLADARYGEAVAAAVVLEPAAALDVDALRAHCGDRLAGYKVPSRIVAVEQLPRNPHTGKVQRADVVELLDVTASAEGSP
jgi:long-chain acyl-CoA synthetase